ncbi:hypothetical protein D3C80_1681340 [compost metagenome]
MLLVLLAQVAALDPEIATLRYNAAMDAWSECIDLRVERLAASAPDVVSKSTLVHVAMDQCYIMATDARRTFPEVARKHLADQGVTSYSESVVDLLADEMLKGVSETMLELKVAQFSD